MVPVVAAVLMEVVLRDSCQVWATFVGAETWSADGVTFGETVEETGLCIAAMLLPDV